MTSASTYRERGSHTFEERALSQRLDPYLVEEWRETVIDAGRLEGNFDIDARIRELDTEGVAAEVLFPDFGLPFELYSPLLAAQLKRADARRGPCSRRQRRLQPLAGRLCWRPP